MEKRWIDVVLDIAELTSLAAFVAMIARSTNVACRHVPKQVDADSSATSSCSSDSCSNVFSSFPLYGLMLW